METRRGIHSPAAPLLGVYSSTLLTSRLGGIFQTIGVILGQFGP
jgi:hypothetical protein